jgi:hypothetical protein
MRVVFYVYLCFLLLCGGNVLYANTHKTLSANPSAKDLAKKHRVKFTSQDQGQTLLEDADIDLSEDHLSGHDEDGGTNEFFSLKYSLPGNWYLTFSLLPALCYHNRPLNTLPPYIGYSCPLYIAQRVLRI